MTFLIDVLILPHQQLLDPQGKATLHGLKQLDLQAVTDVRVGKRIQLSVQSETAEEALSFATQAAKKLLANPITETFEIQLIS